MPDIYCIDFETFYSKEYSLSRKDVTTQSYVDDERYETIGVAVKKNGEPTAWFSGTHEEIRDWLGRFDWANAFMLAHNALFDASILAWRFGIHPKLILDTLSMARAVHGVDAGGSLKALAERYELGVKGEEVVLAMGKRRADFAELELKAYGEYCKNDVELTYELFKRLAPAFIKSEIALIDMTIKMHTKPQFQLDTALLHEHLTDVRGRKTILLIESGIAKEDLMSNPKLAEVLKSFGVTPPVKVSPRTGKIAYAFAKSDAEFKALLEHDNFSVQAVVAARLGVKSTLEETRTERFIRIAEESGSLPVPLKYYGAITGRWSAVDSINLQNLPRTSPLKKAIVAPLGYSIVGADLSNIELRVGLYFAGQMDKLEMLGDGLDLYKDFAASAFNIRYADVTDEQRFVGKTCIAEGTLVLCYSGWKPIEAVSLSDKVWDGEEWVCHQGLVSKGYKETLSLCGSWLTPDHLVWSGTQWLESQSVVSDASILSQALGIGAANLPLQATFKAREGELPRLLSNATAASLNTLWISIISKTSKALDAINAGLQQVGLKGSGLTPKPCLMTSIGVGCLTESPQQLTAAITPKTATIKTMGAEASRCTHYGAWIKRSFSRTRKHLMVGMFQSLTWIASTIMVITNRATLGLSPERRIPETSAKSVSLRRRLPVYDLLCAGPRNRFTILTDSGPIIVHNCQLSLIYGTGHVKLREQIKMLSGRDIGETFAKKVVEIYRDDYYMVKKAWHDAGNALYAIAQNEEYDIGLGALSLKVIGARGIRLPSNLYMTYNDLTPSMDSSNRLQWVYKTRKGPVHIHAAKCFQNIIQALARCVMGEAMVRVHKKYPVGLTIHDALYGIVPTEQSLEAMKFIVEELRRPPEWLPNIPLDAECGFGDNLSFKMKKLESYF